MQYRATGDILDSIFRSNLCNFLYRTNALSNIYFWILYSCIALDRLPWEFSSYQYHTCIFQLFPSFLTSNTYANKHMRYRGIFIRIFLKFENFENFNFSSEKRPRNAWVTADVTCTWWSKIRPWFSARYPLWHRGSIFVRPWAIKVSIEPRNLSTIRGLFQSVFSRNAWEKRLENFYSLQKRPVGLKLYVF